MPTIEQILHNKKETINGSTSGSIEASMPFRSNNYKKVIILLNGLNGTAVYTFPVPFSANNSIPPDISGSMVGTASFTGEDRTFITITGIGPISSGWVIIQGN